MIYVPYIIWYINSYKLYSCWYWRTLTNKNLTYSILPCSSHWTYSNIFKGYITYTLGKENSVLCIIRIGSSVWLGITHSRTDIETEFRHSASIIKAEAFVYQIWTNLVYPIYKDNCGSVDLYSYVAQPLVYVENYHLILVKIIWLLGTFPRVTYKQRRKTVEA